jgi:hypothetical protein
LGLIASNTPGGMVEPDDEEKALIAADMLY